jgi:hypothetical protein
LVCCRGESLLQSGLGFDLRVMTQARVEEDARARAEEAKVREEARRKAHDEAIARKCATAAHEDGNDVSSHARGQASAARRRGCMRYAFQRASAAALLSAAGSLAHCAILSSAAITL